MKKIILIVLVVFCLQASYMFAEEPLTEIRLVSEEWDGATNADGTGLYWDILRKVYEPLGIRVTFEMYPYMRCVKMVQGQRPEADALVGSYAGEIGGAIYPEYHFDMDAIGAVFLKDSSIRWEGQQSLADKQVGWMRGYSYDEYLDVLVEAKEVSSRQSGLSMVEKGRLDVFLDPIVELETELEQEHYEGRREQFRIETALKLKMYLAFANDERGRALSNIFDQQMKALIASGELKPIYEKWNYADYPFENTLSE